MTKLFTKLTLIALTCAGIAPIALVAAHPHRRCVQRQICYKRCMSACIRSCAMPKQQRVPNAHAQQAAPYARPACQARCHQQRHHSSSPTPKQRSVHHHYKYHVHAHGHMQRRCCR